MLAAPLVGGCMTVTVNDESRPPGCATFDRIAVTIEADGPEADVTEPLQQIEREARSGGDTDVADAAAALLAAHGGRTVNWYSALGDMEAACRGQR
jgi:hypothetical protein